MLITTNKIIIALFVISLITSSAIGATRTSGELFQLGNADRTYIYATGGATTTITCYLGQLYPGQPIYFCMYPDGSMDHSWFIYQQKEMEQYYTGTTTNTLTTIKKK